MSRHPYPVIFTCLILTAISSVGFLKFRFVLRAIQARLTTFTFSKFHFHFSFLLAHSHRNLFCQLFEAQVCPWSDPSSFDHFHFLKISLSIFFFCCLILTATSFVSFLKFRFVLGAIQACLTTFTFSKFHFHFSFFLPHSHCNLFCRLFEVQVCPWSDPSSFDHFHFRKIPLSLFFAASFLLQSLLSAF